MRLLPVAALLLLVASGGVARGAGSGSLLIFSDAALTDSTLTDDAPRIANIYILHADFDYGTGVSFMTAPSAGFAGVWLGETTSFVSVGKTTTGVSVGYGSCLVPPVLVMTVTYQFFGTSSACSQLSIAPEPGFGFVFCTCGGGCIDELPIPKLGRLHVNCPVAVEFTTWGRVKALYRN